MLLEGHSLSCDSVFTQAVDKVGQTTLYKKVPERDLRNSGKRTFFYPRFK